MKSVEKVSSQPIVILLVEYLFFSSRLAHVLHVFSRSELSETSVMETAA